jgi:hypothetical protein
MILIQRIKTQWTKVSRGGVLATKRNSTPESLLLPPGIDTSCDCILHDVRYCEWHDFECHDDVVELDTFPMIRIEPIWITFSERVLRVRFVWNWIGCGAPERMSYDLFHLDFDQWGRFTCNGRLGPETYYQSQWRYHKTVFNIAWTDDFDENVFLVKAPHAEHSSLEALK